MTAVDIKRAVRAVQNQTGANDDRPTLLLLNHLQLTLSDSEKSRQRSDKRDALDGLLTLTSLKCLMRDAKIAIIIIGVANMTPSESTREEDTTYHASCAADYTLWLHSDNVAVKGPVCEKDVDQLHLARE